MGIIQAERYHDISCGHRVVGHEGACRNLHGHNYRFEFAIEASELDKVGRVIDFSVIKEKLAMWLEDNYDHKMLLWENDTHLIELLEINPKGIFVTDFNPTAENIAIDFVENIAPKQLEGTGTTLVKLKIWETRKCSVTYKKTKKTL